MDEWVPILVLPNADMRFAFDCPHAAIVSSQDARVLKLRDDHPNLTSFLSRFRDQFGDQVWPALLLIRADAPRSYYSAEAVTAFRDILSLSVVLYTRANSLLCRQRARLHEHVPVLPVDARQSLRGHAPAEPRDGARPLTQLVRRPVVSGAGLRFDHGRRRGSAARLGAAGSVGRSVLRRSRRVEGPGAFPLAQHGERGWPHPGGDGRSVLGRWAFARPVGQRFGNTGAPRRRQKSNIGTVSALLERVRWLDRTLAAATHTVSGRQRQLATWVCRKVYDRRNNFLHGNDVDRTGLVLNGRRMTDLAACLFRLALTGFLDLHFDTPKPDPSDAQAFAAFIHQQMAFNKFQRMYEGELLAAV